MIWLVTFLSCIGLLCAEEPFNHNVHNERVIGGHDAKPNTWKWQVSLQHGSSDEESFYHICGGSIIDSLYIMTAAHRILRLICAEEPFNHNVHNGRVIGGHDSKPNTWKWQVSLQHDSYNDNYFYHICGGSIIDAFHVMTAAHCILSMDPTEYRVVVGEYNLYEYDGSEQFIRVDRIVVHPGWNGDLANGNDIAILRLADPVYDNGYVAIANFPYPGETLPHGFTCTITGWGLIDFQGNVPAVLQEAPLDVVEHSVCSQYDWWGSVALNTMVCAGGDGIISGCQGDSGGPLSCYTNGAWTVHGVVSYGPAGMCNQYKKPTVFTRVSSFLDWMYSVMNLA